MYHQQQDYAAGWPKITDGRKYPKALYPHKLYDQMKTFKNIYIIVMIHTEDK